MKQSLKEEFYELVCKKGDNVRAASIAAKIFLEPKRSEQILKLLWSYNDGPSERIFYTRFIADLLSEPTRSQELAKILEECKASGNLDEAHETAKYLGRKLTGKELEDFLRSFIERGNFVQANEVAVLLGRELTTEEARKGFDVRLEKGNYEGAQNAAESLPEDERVAAFDRVLRSCIERGNLQGAIRTAHSQYFQRDLTLDELKEILEAQMAKGCSSDARKTVAMMGVTESSMVAIQKILEEDINRGNVTEAMEMAKLLGRKLSVPEFQEMIFTLIRWGLVESAYEVTAYLPKEERAKAVRAVIKASLEYGYRLRFASEIAESLSEPDRSTWLLAILRKQLQGRDSLSDSCETVDMLIASL